MGNLKGEKKVNVTFRHGKDGGNVTLTIRVKGSISTLTCKKVKNKLSGKGVIQRGLHIIGWAQA